MSPLATHSMAGRPARPHTLDVVSFSLEHAYGGYGDAVIVLDDKHIFGHDQ